MTPAVRDTNPFYAVYFTADLPQAYNRTLVGIARGCIDTGNSCHCSGTILIPSHFHEHVPGTMCHTVCHILYDIKNVFNNFF